MGWGTAIWNGIKFIGGKLVNKVTEASSNDKSSNSDNIDKVQEEISKKIKNISSSDNIYSMQEAAAKREEINNTRRAMDKIQNDSTKESKTKLEESTRGMSEDDRVKKIMQLIVDLDVNKTKTIRKLIEKGNIDKAEKKANKLSGKGVGNYSEDEKGGGGIKSILGTVLTGLKSVATLVGIGILTTITTSKDEDENLGDNVKRAKDNLIKAQDSYNKSDKELSGFITNNKDYKSTVEDLKNIYGDEFNQYSIDKTINKFNDLQNSELLKEFKAIQKSINKLTKKDNLFKDMISSYVDYLNDKSFEHQLEFSLAYNKLLRDSFEGLDKSLNEKYWTQEEFSKKLTSYLFGEFESNSKKIDQFYVLNKFLHLYSFGIIDINRYNKDLIIALKNTNENQYENKIELNNQYVWNKIEDNYQFKFFFNKPIKDDCFYFYCKTKYCYGIFVTALWWDSIGVGINKDLRLILTDYIKDYKLSNASKQLAELKSKKDSEQEKYSNELTSFNRNAISNLDKDKQNKIDEFEKYKSSEEYKNITFAEEDAISDLDTKSDISILNTYNEYSKLDKDHKTDKLNTHLQNMSKDIYIKVFYLIERLMAGTFALMRGFTNKTSVDDIKDKEETINNFINKYYKYTNIEALLNNENAIIQLSNQTIFDDYISRITSDPKSFINNSYFTDVINKFQTKLTKQEYPTKDNDATNCSVPDIRYNIIGIRVLKYYFDNVTNIRQRIYDNNASEIENNLQNGDKQPVTKISNINQIKVDFSNCIKTTMDYYYGVILSTHDPYAYFKDKNKIGIMDKYFDHDLPTTNTSFNVTTNDTTTSSNDMTNSSPSRSVTVNAPSSNITDVYSNGLNYNMSHTGNDIPGIIPRNTGKSGSQNGIINGDINPIDLLNKIDTKVDAIDRKTTNISSSQIEEGKMILGVQSAISGGNSSDRLPMNQQSY